MTLAYVVFVAAALIGLGCGGLLLRRSLVGLLVAFQLLLGGVALLAGGLLALVGEEGGVGQVIALACIAIGAAAAVLFLALHVAAARAARAERGLEPW